MFLQHDLFTFAMSITDGWQNDLWIKKKQKEFRDSLIG